MIRRGIIGAAVVWIAAAADSVAGHPAGGAVEFNRHVRPILADRCFPCHGPDGNKRAAGLRLDLAEGALGPLPNHASRHAFVPGKPETSDACRRILSADPADQMPPPASKLRLSEAEKDVIVRWVAQGAKYQKHWAFEKPVRPDPPPVNDGAWPRTDLDRFVLARLEQEGLKPSPEADRVTLIRRASLDITGLPPTVAEVDAFVADAAPDAYERLVDRLLASPRHAERLAQDWLDYARYADSHGFQADWQRFMWRWRDWLIHAFMTNMPFDRFTTEQLAGDLLPQPTREQRIATGFNRNHRINTEGGVIAEEWRLETVIDRVDTTSQTWLGLTLSCARCHDHKYDPISQNEFYSFAAFFNSVNETGSGAERPANIAPLMKAPTPEQAQALARLATEQAEAEAARKAAEASLPAVVAAWTNAAALPPEPAGAALQFAFDGAFDGLDAGSAVAAARLAGAAPAFVEGVSGNALRLGGASALDAGAAFAAGRTNAFSYGGWVRLPTLDGTGVMLSRMEPGPGYRGFDLYLTRGRVAVHLISRWSEDAIKVTTKKPLRAGAWEHVFAVYDGSGKAAGVKVYVNGKAEDTEAEADRLQGDLGANAPLLLGARVQSDRLAGDLDELRLYPRALAPHEVAALAERPAALAAAAAPPARRGPPQKKTLEAFARHALPGAAAAAERLARVEKERKELEAKVDDVMVMEDLAKPRDTFVLLRGQYDRPGEKVSPGVPAIFPPLPADAPSNRLGLARWIVSPDNPLTARVAANRVWERLFGRGLVRTSENLGSQAEWPSHPELLDWLATEFIRLGWDLRAFERTILLSAAYRQSSRITPELRERDPENLLLARHPRLRLPAEGIRDQALAISGLLVEKIGGPPVRPYQPAGIWDELNVYGNLRNYQPDTGEGLYRRTLYTIWKRTTPPPNLTVFDTPGREICTVRRPRTNTPLQALALMGQATYLEAARVLGERMLAEGGGNPDGRIAYAFRRAVARPPTADEAAILRRTYDRSLARYLADGDGARALASVGAAPPRAGLDPAEVAACALTAGVILNLDETITKP